MMMDNNSHRWSLHYKENKLEMITTHIGVNKRYKDCKIVMIHKQWHYHKITMFTLKNMWTAIRTMRIGYWKTGTIRIGYWNTTLTIIITKTVNIILTKTLNMILTKTVNMILTRTVNIILNS